MIDFDDFLDTLWGVFKVAFVTPLIVFTVLLGLLPWILLFSYLVYIIGGKA